MREITGSVNGNLNAYWSRSCRRRFTVLDLKVQHIVEFTATFSNSCAAHAQKRLFMSFWCKLRHRRLIRRPDFLLECRISAWTPTSIISTRFEIDMTINCRVIAFVSADTSRDLVSLTFDVIAPSWYLTLKICHTWRVTWPTLPPSMKTLRLSFLQLRVITFP